MLLRALVHILATAAALLLLTQLNIGIAVDDFYSAVIVALLWGIVGLTLRPILNILTLPLNILTLGLFSFIINALLFWFLSTFVEGFHVAGFLAALIGSLILTAVAWVLHRVF